MTLTLDKLAESFGKEIKAKEKEPERETIIVKWHYVAEYIVDLLDNDPEILNSSYVTVSGSMDSECYYSECVSNANIEDFIDPKEYSPGVYRFVFGVRALGDSYWTDCGMEYDAWEEYDLFSMYKYTDEEVKICFKQIQMDDPMFELREEFKDESN